LYVKPSHQAQHAVPAVALQKTWQSWGVVAAVTGAVEMMTSDHWYCTSGPHCGPHTLGPPPSQASGAVHVPHARFPPQPSACVPQFCPFVHCVAGMQPHTLGVPPPPHVCPRPLQVPHEIIPLHPSVCMPQSRPVGHEVFFVQLAVQVVP